MIAKLVESIYNAGNFAEKLDNTTQKIVDGFDNTASTIANRIYNGFDIPYKIDEALFGKQEPGDPLKKMYEELKEWGIIDKALEKYNDLVEKLPEKEREEYNKGLKKILDKYTEISRKQGYISPNGLIELENYIRRYFDLGEYARDVSYDLMFKGVYGEASQPAPQSQEGQQ